MIITNCLVIKDMKIDNLEKTISDLIIRDLWSEWISTRYMLKLVTPPIIKTCITITHFTPDEVKDYATEHTAGVGYIKQQPRQEGKAIYADGFDYYKLEGNLK